MAARLGTLPYSYSLDQHSIFFTVFQFLVEIRDLEVGVHLQ